MMAFSAVTAAWAFCIVGHAELESELFVQLMRASHPFPGWRLRSLLLMELGVMTYRRHCKGGLNPPRLLLPCGGG